MQYYNIENFDNTGLVKTLMVPKNQARWRIYSYNAKANMEDIKYYTDLGKYFGITPDDMIRVQQNHTNNIMLAKKNDAGMGVTRVEKKEFCDGIITNEKGVMLLTVEADCTPVYILDPINKAIGMVHSGWRGTVNKITEKALDMMSKNYGTKKEEVLIHLGPAICGKCYEVGIDLVAEFKKILKCEDVHKIFTPILDKEEKYYLDVSEGLRLSLLKYGIKNENITRSNICTYHNNIFDSWRLSKDKTKQMLTGIMLL